MVMYNPPHPGKILKEEFIAPMGLSVAKTASALNVTRQTLYDLLNQDTGVSPEMAIRIAKVFNSNPELWLTLQLKYELWNASKKKIKVAPLIIKQSGQTEKERSIN